MKTQLTNSKEKIISIADKLINGYSLHEAINSDSDEYNIIDKYKFFEHCENTFSGIDETLIELVKDPKITDIMINNDGNIWIDTNTGMEKTNIQISKEKAKEIAIKMASVCEKRLDNSVPIVDGTLPNGIRFNAILDPISPNGTCISLRLKTNIVPVFDELFNSKTINYSSKEIIKKIVESKKSFLISGATGTGKTTLLSALTSLFDTYERVLFIEETKEIISQHNNCVFLQSRDKNIENKGEITLSTLVHAAMRMRPDRIILGECRGKEIADILNAFNTGHEGGICTIHSNSVQDLPSRLLALGKLANLDIETISYQTYSAIKIVIHLNRQKIEGKIHRWISQIGIFEIDKYKLICTPCVHISHTGKITFLPKWEKLKELINYENSTD